MATIADQILAAIRHSPLDDDQLARQLGVSHRQSINQTARRLEIEGKLQRYVGPIVNAPAAGIAERPAPSRSSATSDFLTEDEVKSAVKDLLKREGFTVHVAWGRTQGVDVDARHPDGRRWQIEAKGEVAPGPQQVNYFLNALGELIQRMDNPHASYALALPDNRQYRGLVDRLPDLAFQRLRLHVFWVSHDQAWLAR